MINPRTVRVVIPCYSGRIVAELAGSLIASSRYFSAVSFMQGVSHVALARNQIAHSFLRSDSEWLVSIDDDIAFHPQDFGLLMEPTDNRMRGDTAPTRIECTQLAKSDQPMGALGIVGALLDVQAEADALVCAEYSYKDDNLRPCRMGLGFTRIHRSVFEKIRDLKHEDGEPRTWQYQSAGQLYTDFYPCGALFAQVLPTAQWTGEDHGFFALAALAGIVARIETRTQLYHIGTKAYPYAGDRGGGN